MAPGGGHVHSPRRPGTEGTDTMGHLLATMAALAAFMSASAAQTQAAPKPSAPTRGPGTQEPQTQEPETTAQLRKRLEDVEQRLRQVESDRAAPPTAAPQLQSDFAPEKVPF